MMDKASGYISLHRKILDWEWFKDTNTLALFIYLLLSANFTDARFLGKKIKRGQVVTSLGHLAEKTGLSVQNVKTSLKHLILTGEVTNVSCQQYRIITIVKYDEYQNPTNQLTDQLTNSQQTTNKRLTNGQQQYNKNNKNNKKNNDNKRERTPLTRFSPPSKDELESFILEHGLQMDADRFLDYYESNGWKVGRNPMKDWKAAARNWAKRDRQDKPTSTAQNYSQRDYSGEDDRAFAEMMSKIHSAGEGQA